MLVLAVHPVAAATQARSVRSELTDPDAARSEARDILSQRRYRPSELPRPFGGPLRALQRAIGRMWDRIARILPGGEATLWVIVGASVIAASALITARLSRRRRSVATQGTVARVATAERTEEVRSLLKQADRAEAEGDARTAIRLRFRAGLLRLSSAGAIVFRPSITTGEVRRRLRLADFDVVASSFEEIAYGERDPEPTDLELSRVGWQRVLQKTAA